MAETEVKSINGRPVADVTARAKIEEIKNAAPGLVFDTTADMEAYIAENADTLKVGQDLYIRATDVPDYWWDGTAAVPVETELGEVKRELAELSEAIFAQEKMIPHVYSWANAELPFTEDEISDAASGAGFVVNPTNFADGKTYFRYHAGATSFTWTNPNPQKGSVTITARGISQWGGTGGTRLLTIYDDGTYGPALYIVVNGESQTVTVTTDPEKTLAKIAGNYDLENWILLDMDVMSIVADYPMPTDLGITGAVVGQTVKITEVDENGKPTKWEAVDMESGGTSDAVQFIQQELTEEQQMQARVNLGLYWKEYVNKVLANIETYSRKTDISDFSDIFDSGSVNINYEDYNGAVNYQLERQSSENSDAGGVFHDVLWFGNGNLIKNDTDLYETVSEIEETKYTDVPFVLYKNISDYTGTTCRLYIDSTAVPGMALGAGVYLDIIDTENFDEVYHPVPQEYIPVLDEIVLNSSDESGRQFRITVDDTGALSATEITE